MAWDRAAPRGRLFRVRRGRRAARGPARDAGRRERRRRAERRARRAGGPLPADRSGRHGRFLGAARTEQGHRSPPARDRNRARRVATLSEQTGLSREELLARLSRELPQAVFTPDPPEALRPERPDEPAGRRLAEKAAPVAARRGLKPRRRPLMTHSFDRLRPGAERKAGRGPHGPDRSSFPCLRSRRRHEPFPRLAPRVEASTRLRARAGDRGKAMEWHSTSMCS